MSHQTGIKASDSLVKFFATAKDGNVRCMKIAIKDEELVLDDYKEPQGTFEEDYDNCVSPFLLENEPTYVLYRMDTKNDQGYQWLFIAYSPDFSKVRDKMMYAGTRATLKMDFGNGHISDEIFATHSSDASLAGYKKHIVSKNADAPLTDAEMELKEMKKNEHHRQHGVSSKHVTLPGINFPMDDDAIEKLEELRDNQIMYVQLKIDIEKEEILLAKSEAELSVESLPANVPTDEARYHFFLFKHTHEGDYLESIVFIYSMPGYSCSVKERMLYSSCKASVIALCEQYLKMEIPRKVEISDGSELSEEFLQDELHPKKILHQPKFAKPKPPPGRGAKRMTKGDNNT
ncbi:twinfilin-1-like [Rhopilema esculentum]|uniref:twinfilin-1-like n=1 Tax=Rhopilema esculentum TaxID=499914 RepID=UPI0031E255D6